MAQMPQIESFDTSNYYAPTFTPDTEIKDYIMQQTMYRIKNPKASLDFYTNVLGFTLISHSDFPQWGFTVYFVAYLPPGLDRDHFLSKMGFPAAGNKADMSKFCMNCPGCVELTWNHGSELEDGNADQGGRVYNTGNGDMVGTGDNTKVRGGFGHIGITVPDVYAACARFLEKCGGDKSIFHKSPNSGGMKGLAFIKDPDGYMIEILPQNGFVTEQIDCCGVDKDGGSGYKDNSKA